MGVELLERRSGGTGGLSLDSWSSWFTGVSGSAWHTRTKTYLLSEKLTTKGLYFYLGLKHNPELKMGGGGGGGGHLEKHLNEDACWTPLLSKSQEVGWVGVEVLNVRRTKCFNSF